VIALEVQILSPRLKCILVANLATTCYNQFMRIISVKKLREYWLKHPDVEQALRICVQHARRSTWRTTEILNEVMPLPVFYPATGLFSIFEAIIGLLWCNL
jgi:hypothetical protein